MVAEPGESSDAFEPEQLREEEVGVLKCRAVVVDEDRRRENPTHKGKVNPLMMISKMYAGASSTSQSPPRVGPTRA